MAEIRQLMIGLLIFSGVVIGMAQFYGDVTSDANLQAYGYNSTQITAINPQDLSSKNVTNQITSTTTQVKETLEEEKTGLSGVDLAWGYINSALNVVALPLTAMALFTNLITDAVGLLGIPPFITSIVLGIIVIIIVFEIMGAFLKWKV